MFQPTTPRPATYTRSGTHEFRKGGLFCLVIMLGKVVAYGAWKAITKR